MSTHFLLHYFLLGLQFSKFKIKFNPGLSLLLLPQFTASNELSRCCSGGSKHFKEHGNCVSVRAVGSSHSCNRAGSICCLRSLIDASCQAGLLYAQRHKVCSAVNINELAGGVKRVSRYFNKHRRISLICRYAFKSLTHRRTMQSKKVFIWQ
uniref:Uncharacterized protein n=1 Tax=Meloidogyne enterolobii TaxID=390850 RepID=A0A6V7Y8P7_MELEN|nr:unnamed protein product [Meloidogyne enterolobii]